MNNMLKDLFSKTDVVGKASQIIDKAISDKDKRNEIVSELATMMLKSNIAPYVRAVLSIIIVVSVLFFGDKITLSDTTQEYCIYSVLGYYFLDRVFDNFKKRK
jgi:hypothetical protein